MDKLEIGKLIKERRKSLDLTQQTLAEIAGLGLRYLVDIENGKGNPSIEHLAKIVNVIGLEITVRDK